MTHYGWPEFLVGRSRLPSLGRMGDGMVKIDRPCRVQGSYLREQGTWACRAVASYFGADQSRARRGRYGSQSRRRAYRNMCQNVRTLNDTTSSRLQAEGRIETTRTSLRRHPRTVPTDLTPRGVQKPAGRRPGVEVAGCPPQLRRRAYRNVNCATIRLLQAVRVPTAVTPKGV